MQNDLPPKQPWPQGLSEEAFTAFVEEHKIPLIDVVTFGAIQAADATTEVVAFDLITPPPAFDDGSWFVEEVGDNVANPLDRWIALSMIGVMIAAAFTFAVIMSDISSFHEQVYSSLLP